MFKLRKKCKDIEGIKIRDGWYFDPLHGYVNFKQKSGNLWEAEISDLFSETKTVFYNPIDTSRCMRVDQSPAMRYASSNIKWLEKVCENVLDTTSLINTQKGKEL